MGTVIKTDSQSPRQSSSTKRMLLIASLLILAAFLVLWSILFYPGTIRQLLPPSEMDRRLARVQIGQERGQALKAYNDAWFHGVCKYTDDVIDDVFLYGSHNIRDVDVLVVRSHPSGGMMRIDNVSSADRDLLRQYGFESCLPEFLLNGGITPAVTQSH